MGKKEYTYNLFDFMKIIKEEVKYNRSGEVIIKSVKGNIPINYSLFGKYKSVSEIFNKERINHSYKLSDNKIIIDLKNIDINNVNSKRIKELAYNILKKYNNLLKFKNNNNLIIVNRRGIYKSIEKILSSKKQRDLLLEHLIVISNLGYIIEHANLVNQTKENKTRININSWNYYYISLTINNVMYDYIFDVRSMDSGENQYRVGRLLKKQIAPSGDASNDTRILPAFEQSVSDNNIT